MARSTKDVLLLCALLGACAWLAHPATGLAVMSVDLGSEWIKIAIVSPGVPMEIALNDESKRKTPAALGFRDGVRVFGEEALNVCLRHPADCYSYLLNLLGKDARHPAVSLYRQRFPHHQLVADERRGTVLFRRSDGALHSPEELVAQLLAKARALAEKSAGQPVEGCVLTVPGHFDQAERKALLQAARLADIKVLRLVNDHSAVALNYVIFRAAELDQVPKHVLFYDMGASSTTAAIYAYRIAKIKEGGRVETRPQLSLVGVAHDDTLGGSEIQTRLRDRLAQRFNETSDAPGDVFRNARAMAKLYAEAGRVKNVLSANMEHYAQIENLLDDRDLRLLVTRDELEALTADLLERVRAPVDRALSAAGLSVESLDRIVLFGGGTRIPRVRDELRSAFGVEPAKNLNTDEAAALGAVYLAAELGSGFRVKKFAVRDAVVRPIRVTFEREADGGSRRVERTLFGHMNPYPQKKIITFNKHVRDFAFNVSYADQDQLGGSDLVQVSLEGVEDAVAEHRGDDVESKGIKAHFVLDESGLLRLAEVEYVVEKKVSAGADSRDENAFSKLGNTISKLFAGGETDGDGDGDADASADAADSQKEDDKDATPAPNASDKSQDEGEPSAPDESAKSESTDEKSTTPDAREKALSKTVALKIPIKVVEKTLTVKELDEKELIESIEKLKALDAAEQETARRATALNDLESFVFDALNKLDEEEYSSAASAEESEKIREASSAASDWLYEEGTDADADTYESKLAQLKSLTRDWYRRVYEHRERPEALNALRAVMNHSRHFLISAQNLTKEANSEKDIFTRVEIETLQKAIDDTHEWAKKMTEEQDKLQNYEPVKLSVKSISEKMAFLDREVKYLINKIKIWKPKKVATPAEKTKSEDKLPDQVQVKEKTLDDHNASGVDGNESAAGESSILSEEEDPSSDVDKTSTVAPETSAKENENHSEL